MRNINLSQEKIDSLNGINFILSPNEHTWDIRLNDLREFLTKHRNCLVPSTHNLFPKLGEWEHKARYRKHNQDKDATRRDFRSA